MKIMLSFMLIAAFAAGGVAQTNGLKRMYVLDATGNESRSVGDAQTRVSR